MRQRADLPAAGAPARLPFFCADFSHDLDRLSSIRDGISAHPIKHLPDSNVQGPHVFFYKRTRRITTPASASITARFTHQTTNSLYSDFLKPEAIAEAAEQHENMLRIFCDTVRLYNESK